MLWTYKLQYNQGIGKSGNFCFYPIPSIPNPTQPYGFPTGTAGIPYNSHSHCRKCKLVPFPTLIGLGREWEWELRVGNDTLCSPNFDCCSTTSSMAVGFWTKGHLQQVLYLCLLWRYIWEAISACFIVGKAFSLISSLWRSAWEQQHCCHNILPDPKLLSWAREAHLLDATNAMWLH